jgi:hypothetical protein
MRDLNASSKVPTRLLVRRRMPVVLDEYRSVYLRVDIMLSYHRSILEYEGRLRPYQNDVMKSWLSRKTYLRLMRFVGGLVVFAALGKHRLHQEARL